jgi:hypothetical protein
MKEVAKCVAGVARGNLPALFGRASRPIRQRRQGKDNERLHLLSELAIK